ncbi:MAG: putative replicase protein [Hampduvirus faecicola]|uniref:RNA-directed RNA polymerase n=1 Tax=Leviviridae sp. TaxID=2027243 RepID=A0ABY3SU40_9VIRU|nr:MAG: putative replicase protein [Leviviridae sp.]
MTKSLVTYCLDVTKAVLADHLSFVPAARRGVERDISRLSSLAQTRGLPLFTLDLPALGKHFDKCLSDGLYVKPDLPISRSIKASPAIPRLFSGLLEEVFEPSGRVRKDACIQSIATLRQVYNLAKKLKIECKRSRTAEAVREFYAIESELIPPTLDWLVEFDFDAEDAEDLSLRTFRDPGGPLFPQWNPGKPHIEETCQKVFDIIFGMMQPFSAASSSFRHGHGAVSDGKLGEFFKYDFPTWSDRLDSVFPSAEFAFANYLTWAAAASQGTTPRREEVPSTVLSVPKTQKGPRLIAKEPTANQFCQQAILAYLEEQISQSWLGIPIKLRDQTQNQLFAKRASETGSHWTVDLSSASDRLSCRLFERVCRRNPTLLNAVRASRSAYSIQKIDKRLPKMLALKKLATMGNASIFPLQSIVFCGMAVAAVCISRQLYPTILNLRKIAREVSVFGDDIIVPTDAGHLLVGMLQHFQLKVNISKTHATGKFRESCGVEVYDGVDVTPAYLQLPPNRRQPASVLSAIDVSNNLFKKGLWKAADHVKRLVPTNEVLVVAPGAECVGFLSFVGSPKYRTYWDDDLQLEYVRGLTLTSKVERTEPNTDGMLLQYFTEGTELPPFSEWRSGYTCRPRQALRRGRVPVRQLAG